MGTVSSVFTGVAVIVDDEIENKKANITKLFRQINKRHIPCVIYKSLPNPNAIAHFKNISFLLLDWNLENETSEDQKLQGVKIGSVLRKAAVKENLDFLKKLKKTCFAPVFIFTNEEKNSIIENLKRENLYDENNTNYIFVKNKNELIKADKLFSEIEKWAKKVPSIYVLKEWEREYQTAKNNLFLDFYVQSPSWPRILWETFKTDGVNSSQELGEIITRNLYSRMTPYAFNDKIISHGNQKISRKEVRKVLEGACFIKKTGLHSESISAGDVFKLSGKIYLNIRPDCDCIPDRNIAESNLDNVELYLLKGSDLPEKKERKDFHRRYGHFNEIDSQAIVFNMLEGKTIDFRFKDLTFKPWSELKDKRIGRILPPYITRIQQRYAMYLQRQGLPRIPEKAVYDRVKTSGK